MALPHPMGHGSVECRQIAANSVLLQAQGRVTRLAMSMQLETFKNLLAGMRASSWIIDTSALKDFEPGAVSVGADYFKRFKEAGGVKVVFVSGLGTARLAAFTIAFAAHLPLVPAQSLSEAYQLLGLGLAPNSDEGTKGRDSATARKA